MFYKFNNISGRVAPTTQAAAYNPQGLSLNAAEVGSFQFDSSSTRPVGVPEPRVQTSVSPEVAGAARGVIPTSSGYQTIVQLQKSWNMSDALMVWQKRGARDSSLYWGTIIFMAVGIGSTAYTLYEMSYPKKKD